MEEKEKGSERWKAAIVNLSEMGSNLDSLQKVLMKKAVFLDEETFAKASLSSEQARTIKALEQRVETLERELDAAITAAARARSEKRQAEAAQRAAELHAQEVTGELENTSKVFQLHMEELHAKQAEISKRDGEIKVLEAIIQTLGGKESHTDYNCCGSCATFHKSSWLLHPLDQALKIFKHDGYTDTAFRKATVDIHSSGHTACMDVRHIGS
ncbi:hypothetical protein BVC80_1813g34 [Macleaya cordata]|uniref:Uncharacterized protein n=1 Tax=Macleaya cordata TaxID=56857 RepID=A0A200QVV3_MACCD|nr:hypothetical protein BVC80_1813g34 [Macleaya cordata]